MDIKLTVTITDESREECSLALMRLAHDLLTDKKESWSGCRSGGGVTEWKFEEVQP